MGGGTGPSLGVPMLEHDLLKLESGRHGSGLLLSLRQTRMDTSQPNRQVGRKMCHLGERSREAKAAAMVDEEAR